MDRGASDLAGFVPPGGATGSFRMARSDSTPDVAPSSFQRTRGRLSLVLGAGDGAGAVRRAYQEGAAKVRFPRRVPGAGCEAVLVNLAGGLTAGDRFDVAVAVEAGAATITTQTCEKIYRAAPGERDVAVVQTLTVAAGARVRWLPQPAILFDGSRLARRTRVEVAAGGSLLLVEGLVLGRRAMGERLRTGAVRDRLEVSRDKRLAFADAVRLCGDIAAITARPAGLGGARAVATLCLIDGHAEAMIEIAREVAAGCTADVAASAWNGMLVARFLAADGGALMDSVAGFVTRLGLGAMPRAWSI